MALFKKKKPVAPEEIDLESIDRESKYKIFSEKGDKIIKVVLTLWALFQLYASISNKVPLQILRYAHLGLAITMAYILYPATQKSNRNKLPWYDCVLAGTFACVAGYFILNYSALQFRAGAYTMLDTIMAGLGIALVLLACWRVVGPPIVIIASCFFVYGMVGNYLPGFLQHRGFSLKRIITHLFITTEGVIGNPLGVCSTYIFLFILFGAFLEKTGIGQFFIDLANALAGEGRSPVLRPSGHGFRFLRVQHGLHRFLHHSDDEIPRLRAGICRRGRSGRFDGRPDHAAGHGICGVPDLRDLQRAVS